MKKEKPRSLLNIILIALLSLTISFMTTPALARSYNSNYISPFANNPSYIPSSSNLNERIDVFKTYQKDDNGIFTGIIVKTKNGTAYRLYKQIRIKSHPSKINGLIYQVKDPHIIRAALYYEARSEGERGIRAVASVIYNRHLSKRWKKLTYSEICSQPLQFSCFNDNVYDHSQDQYKYVIVIKSKQDVDALNLIDRIIVEMRTGKFTPINSATHYVTLDFYNRMKTENPNHWCQKMISTSIVKNHIFGRLPND